MATTTITTKHPLPAWLEFILNMFANQLETTGETLFVGILQKLHDSNLDDWKAAVYELNSVSKRLMPLVEKTPTKLDDGLVIELGLAAKDSVAANPNDGIVLT